MSKANNETSVEISVLYEPADVYTLDRVNYVVHDYALHGVKCEEIEKPYGNTRKLPYPITKYGHVYKYVSKAIFKLDMCRDMLGNLECDLNTTGALRYLIVSKEY